MGIKSDPSDKAQEMPQWRQQDGDWIQGFHEPMLIMHLAARAQSAGAVLQSDGGLQFNNPDFPAYARAYGASGKQIHAAGELVPALEEAFAAGGVHLISVPIDYSENIHL